MSDSSNKSPNSSDVKKKIHLYNKNNRLITNDDIRAVFKKSGIPDFMNISIHDLAVYQRAFTHKSYIEMTNKDYEYDHIPDCVELQKISNERLEFLGDSKIASIVPDYLYFRYTEINEGTMTKLKIKLIKCEKLAEMAKFLDLGNLLLMSKYADDTCNCRSSLNLLENTFEAFVGAIYEDHYLRGNAYIGKGYEVCYKFVTSCIEHTTNFTDLIMVDDNYKGQLTKLYQILFDGEFNPEYNVVSTIGPTNNRTYTVEIKHPNTDDVIGTGTANKKNKAEQLASQQALGELKNEN